jgi:transposase
VDGYFTLWPGSCVRRITKVNLIFGYAAISLPSARNPELLLRILLIGYLYGVTSERKWWN